MVALEVGADDYVTKPYRLRELVARMRAVMRRTPGGRPRAAGRHAAGDGERPGRSGDVTVDLDQRRVHVRGEEVQLRARSSSCWRLLVENAGRVLTRDVLIDRVWGTDYIGDTKTLDVHVKRLRARIEVDPSSPDAHHHRPGASATASTRGPADPRRRGHAPTFSHNDAGAGPDSQAVCWPSVRCSFVLVAGTVGYLILGFGLLDAIFQTVSTVTTVGFNTPHPLAAGGKAFTIVLILSGWGPRSTPSRPVFELLVEGHMRELMRRRRMSHDIDRMRHHVIVCGWGRVGREVARFLANAGRDVVVIDRDTLRLADVPYPTVGGDVTDDDVLLRAGIERADTLVAALDTDRTTSS